MRLRRVMATWNAVSDYFMFLRNDDRVILLQDPGPGYFILQGQGFCAMLLHGPWAGRLCETTLWSLDREERVSYFCPSPCLSEEGMPSLS